MNLEEKNLVEIRKLEKQRKKVGFLINHG